MSDVRVNIRVEIQNNLVEKMEVDDAENNEEMEDGEIDEPIEHQVPLKLPTNLTSKGIFTTDIDLFDDKAQLKLQKRAERFQLKPEEIKNFTETNLKNIYSSLGVTPENEALVRFDAVHLYGIDTTSTAEIFQYFSKYAPIALERISTKECNIVWPDRLSAARALFFTSKAVRGMPVRNDSDPFEDQFESPPTNPNREVQLVHDDDEDAVDITSISISIPPGYWRLGVSTTKSKCVLMRFAYKTDQKPYTIESFDYKKSTTERKSKTVGIFERNKALKDDKNPWGTLAENWDEDVQYREKDRKDEKVQIKNPSILGRLGAKPSEPEEEPVKEKKTKIPRMRMYADEEEEKIKRKRLLQTIKKQYDQLEDNTNPKSDLRNILRITNKRSDVGKQIETDLGSRLKNRGRKMIFQLRDDERRERSPIRRREDVEEGDERWREYDEDDNRTKSKIAVVIKKARKPEVASTVWSRMEKRFDEASSSETEPDDDSDNPTNKSSSENETDANVRSDRPGFLGALQKRLGTDGVEQRSRLKIEINNDHFKN